MATAAVARSQGPLVRTAYRLEELLALRQSVSESAVSLDKFPVEEAIKEHVLRPSHSTNGFAYAPALARGNPISASAPASESKDKSLSTSSNPSFLRSTNQVAATADIKKPSPSPSVKRDKAEKLLKEHGSPPGIRVTAGGRIVPTDMNMGCASSRPGPLPPAALGQDVPNGFVLMNRDGVLMQHLGNYNWAAVYANEDGDYLWPAGVPPTNPVGQDAGLPLQNSPNFPRDSQSLLHGSGTYGMRYPYAPQMHSLYNAARHFEFRLSNLVPQPPPLDVELSYDINEAINYYSTIRSHLSQALKTVEQHIARDILPGHVLRDSLVAQKMELINLLDVLRRETNKMRDMKDKGLQRVVPEELVLGHRGPLPQHGPLDVSAPANLNFGGPLAAVFGYSSPVGPTDAYTAKPAADALQSQLPELGQKRSKAVPIKAPTVSPQPIGESKLNPTSPAYEPSQPVADQGSSGQKSPVCPASPVLEPQSPEFQVGRLYSQDKWLLGRPFNDTDPQANIGQDMKFGKNSNENLFSNLADDTINSLEDKSQQYTLGFLVGLSGRVSNMSKPSDWLHGYCDGLQQRLGASVPTSAQPMATPVPAIPTALPTPPLSVYPVQVSVPADMPQLVENTQTYPSSLPSAATVYNKSWSTHIPRFPGDGPLARSGPMNYSQASSKLFVQYARPTDSIHKLTGYAGNSGTSIQARNVVSLGSLPEPKHFQCSSSAEDSYQTMNVHSASVMHGSEMSAAQQLVNLSSDNGSSEPQPSASNKRSFSNLPPEGTSNVSNSAIRTASLPLIQNSLANHPGRSSGHSPVRSNKTPESPKRSPGKRLEHLTRHFRSSNTSQEQASEGSPSSLNDPANQGERRRWRDGLGRRFSRRERDDDSTPFRTNRNLQSGVAARGKMS